MMKKAVVLLLCTILCCGCGTLMNLNSPNPTNYGGVKEDGKLIVDGIYGKLDHQSLSYPYIFYGMAFFPDVLFRCICVVDLVFSSLGDSVAYLARPAGSADVPKDGSVEVQYDHNPDKP